MSGSLAPLRRKCDRMALLSYVCPESTTTTGSRNMVRVMGHVRTSGSATRSASEAEKTRWACAGCRGRASEVAFPGASDDEVDDICRLAGAIEQRELSGSPVSARSACGLVTDNEAILSDGYVKQVTVREKKHDVNNASAVVSPRVDESNRRERLEASLLQLLRDGHVARLDDLSLLHDVHEVRVDGVEQPLVVGDEQQALVPLLEHVHRVTVDVAGKVF